MGEVHREAPRPEAEIAEQLKSEPMDKIPSTVEVREQARKLVALLDDPQPELSTWVDFRNSEAVKLYKMLGLVLDKIVEAADSGRQSTEK